MEKSSSSHPYWKHVALPNYKTLFKNIQLQNLKESKNLARFSVFDLARPFNGVSSSPCVGSTLLFRYIIGTCIVLKNPYNDGPLVSQLVRHFAFNSRNVSVSVSCFAPQQQQLRNGLAFCHIQMADFSTIHNTYLPLLCHTD